MADLNQFLAQEELDKGAYNVTVGDSTYTLYALHTSVGLTMAQQIISIILPSAGAGVDGYINTEAFSESHSFSEAALYLVNQLGKHDINQIIKVLLHDAKLDGYPVDFEKHFRSKYDVLLELVEAAMRENFSSFFTHMGMRKKLINYLLSVMSPINSSQQTGFQESSETEED